MIPAFHLRPAALSDVDAIVALERATEYAPHWPPKAYADIFHAALKFADGDRSCIPLRCVILAEQPSPTGARLAGFAVGLVHPTPIREDCMAELESVAVAESARRSGIGRSLCNAVLDWCRAHGASEVDLEVRASSIAAIALYASLGFRKVGFRAGYYHDPEDDALLMRLPLAPAEPATSPKQRPCEPV